MADRLTLHPLIRIGERTQAGAYKSERHFLDFVVNGKSLWKAIGESRDRVSVLCAEYLLEDTSRAVNRLLLTADAIIPNDRRYLFICSECGDLGCGAITLTVAKEGDAVLWKNFGYENNYDTEIEFDEYKGVGPFKFDRADYEKTLRVGIERLKTMKT
jgi:hypothetical protein